MIYYKIKCKYTMDEKTEINQAERFWKSFRRTFDREAYRLFLISHDENYFTAVLMFSVKDYSLTSIKKKILCEFDDSKRTIKSSNE